MRVGIVGMGIMGQAIAAKLLSTGLPVYVNNRTREKAEAAIAMGAEWADTPAELAARSDVVISLVTDPAAVDSVSFGPQGVLAGLPASSVHCDMSTVAPASAEATARHYREAERQFVQAPVLGSKKQIADGTLLVFGGGEAADIVACEQIWKAFSGRVWRLAEPGQAAALKLACNLLIAHTILGLGESLLFAKAGGIEPSLLLEVLGASALGSPMMGSKGKTILERSFVPNFVVRNLLKDLNLADSAAKASSIPLPHGTLSRELFTAAVAQGLGDEDYSAVVKVLESLAATSIAD